MKRIEQYSVRHYEGEWIAARGFCIDGTCSAERYVSLGDSEMLRAVRRLSGRGGVSLERAGLLAEKAEVGDRSRVAEINRRLWELEYVGEVVSVETRSVGVYRKLASGGFLLDGERYVRLMCGAGHARTNRTLFVAERIFEGLDEVLRCGLPRDVEVAPSKWNAYYALTSSATYRVSEPRVVVVDDKEVEMAKVVEWIEHDEESGVDTLSKQKRGLTFNLWDGMGLISPEFAGRWAVDLELEYVPSAFVLRNAFCKGLVAVFDFHRFGAEVAGGVKIKDIWGGLHDCEDVDIILTKSQFKMWYAYKGWDEYIEATHRCGLSWGVSKFSPDPALEKNVVFTNYQFLQVLDFNDANLKGFCDYTASWFRDVCGGDMRALEIYLLGKAARSKSLNDVWNRIGDPYVKALLLEPELARDSYIKERIARSIDKKMRQSKMGKLLTKGNFQFMIADPYGLAQHAFGLEVTGLLKEHEHYSQYWNKFGAERVIAERAPLTWRSEVNVLNLQKSAEMDDWYSYTNSGIIYNVWGVDCMLAADSDFDGDIVYTTNNKYMLESVCEEVKGVPITYQPSKIKKVKLNYGDLHKYDAFAYNTKIGYITNCSTTLYEMQHLYEPGSAEFEEIENRLKLCRKAQGMEIDKAKIGAKVPSIPQHWIRKNGDEFNDKLLIEKRPYFMRYLYNQYNKEYKNHVADFDRYSMVQYGYKYHDLPEEIKATSEYKELKEYYDRKCPLLETDGVMNRMCRYMEGALKGVKKATKNLTSEEAYPLLSTAFGIDKEKLNQMWELFLEYSDFKKGKMLLSSNFATYEQYYKYLRRKASEEITTDREELANLAVEIGYRAKGGSKEFCWDVFGRYIVENIIKRKNQRGEEIIELPIYDEGGDYEYLGEKYSIKSFNFNCVDGYEGEDNFCELDFDEDELLGDFE